MHVCWGSWPAPHMYCVPLREIADLILSVKAQCFSIEAAKANHTRVGGVAGHRSSRWQDPDARAVDHTTDVREHPEVIAERIIRFASVVGRENVIAGTDCGMRGHPARDWIKYRAMVEAPSRFAQALEASLRRAERRSVRTFRPDAPPVLHGACPKRCRNRRAKWLGSANPQRSATSVISSWLRRSSLSISWARSSRIRNSSCRKRGARVRERVVQGPKRDLMELGHACRRKRAGSWRLSVSVLRSDSSRGHRLELAFGPAASVSSTATFSATAAAGTASRDIESGCRVPTTLHSAELHAPEFRDKYEQRSAEKATVPATASKGERHARTRLIAFERKRLREVERKHSAGAHDKLSSRRATVVVPERG